MAITCGLLILQISEILIKNPFEINKNDVVYITNLHQLASIWIGITIIFAITETILLVKIEETLIRNDRLENKIDYEVFIQEDCH